MNGSIWRRTGLVVVGGACLLGVAAVAAWLWPNRAFPDGGTQIVFLRVENVGPGRDIYAVDADGREQRLTRGFLAGEPAASADGSRIAFTADSGRGCRSTCVREIYVMRADGSRQRRLTRNSVADTDPSLSPDGSLIAFTRSRGRILPGSDIRRSGIYVMRSDGSGARRLSATGQRPVFSPDGSAIAYTRVPMRPGRSAIYVVGADGSPRPRRLGTGDSPAYSPDGSHIAFADRGAVFVMNADGTRRRRVSHTRDARSPVFSPDGSRVAFLSVPFNQSDLYVVDVDGSHQTQLTKTSPGWDGRFAGAESPVFSPDGKRIAYALSGNGIHIIDTDGSGHGRVTAPAGSDLSPVWTSPPRP